MISGAAGSSDALDLALRVLTEYLIIVLGDAVSEPIVGTHQDGISEYCSSKEKPLMSFLEELRHLPVKTAMQNNGGESAEPRDGNTPVTGKDTTLIKSDVKGGMLRVERSVEWLENTAAHINKLLSATFPHICVHPSRKVKMGLLASVEALMCKCSHSLKESRLMFLECLRLGL